MYGRGKTGCGRVERAVTTQDVELGAFFQSVSGVRRSYLRHSGRRSGMKKYIREMIDDLKKSKAKAKGFIPPVPKGPKENPVVKLTPPPEPVVPQDLSNQELSKNAEERVKQLDYQAFESERLQTDS